jgi:plastocyanin
MFRTWKRSLPVVAAVVLALSSSLPAQAATVVKAGAGTTCTSFKPAKVSIAKGTKVVWKDVCRSHTVTSYSKNWSKDTTLSSVGQTTSFRFLKKGTFKYRCRFHSSLVNGVCSGMCGKVVVGT